MLFSVLVQRPLAPVVEAQVALVDRSAAVELLDGEGRSEARETAADDHDVQPREVRFSCARTRRRRGRRGPHGHGPLVRRTERRQDAQRQSQDKNFSSA